MKLPHEQHGGSAFPMEMHNGDGSKFTAFGMSMRDYFAAHVLAGICARAGFAINGQHEGLADTAYKMADAMLRARSQTEN